MKDAENCSLRAKKYGLIDAVKGVYFNNIIIERLVETKLKIFRKWNKSVYLSNSFI